MLERLGAAMHARISRLPLSKAFFPDYDSGFRQLSCSGRFALGIGPPNLLRSPVEYEELRFRNTSGTA